MKIEIKKIIGTSRAVTFDLGVNVRSIYGDAWRNEVIDLDFTGITSVSPSFLSQALSPILRSVPASDIGQYVSFKNPPDSLDRTWRLLQQAVINGNQEV